MTGQIPTPIRTGAVVRVAGAADAGVPYLAYEYVDIRFPHGHIERWLGMATGGRIPKSHDPALGLLTSVQTDAVWEHGVLASELATDLGEPTARLFTNLPVEIVVEWNVKLPVEAGVRLPADEGSESA